MFMQEQETFGDTFNQSFEDHLENLNEDIDMNVFLKNLTDMKDGQRNTKKAIKAISKTNVFKQQLTDKKKRKKKSEKKTPNKRILRNKSKSAKNLTVNRDRMEKNLDRFKVVVENKAADRLNEKVKEINGIMEDNIRNAKLRGKSPNTISLKKFDRVYDRLTGHKLRTEAKINNLKDEKVMQEVQEATFKPRINRGSRVYHKNIMEASNYHLHSKEERLKQKQQMLKEKKDEEYVEHCTFKPKINNGRIQKRSINDLYTWQEEQKLKKKRIEQEYEVEQGKVASFTPTINTNYQKKQRDKYENVGERLYAIHKVKNEEKEKRLKSKTPKKRRKSIIGNTSSINREMDEERDQVFVLDSNNPKQRKNKSITRVMSSQYIRSTKLGHKPQTMSKQNIFYTDMDNDYDDEQQSKSSKNFMRENKKRIKEREKKLKEMKKEKSEKKLRKTSKSRSYTKLLNGKKDKRVKIGNIEDVMEGISDLNLHYG